MANQTTIYKEKNITVEVERIFTGSETAKDRILALLRKELSSKEPAR